MMEIGHFDRAIECKDNVELVLTYIIQSSSLMTYFRFIVIMS